MLDLEAIAALHEAEIDIYSTGSMDCFQRMAATECTIIFTEGQGKINFENGTLDLETMTLFLFTGGSDIRSCTVSVGNAIMFPIFNSYCANNGHKSPLPKNVLSSTICNMGTGVSAKRGRNEGRVVCGLQGIRLRVDQDPWMTDEEERSRYVDDVLLIGSTEMLMAVDGRLRVVSRVINTINRVCKRACRAE